ncbi:MAG: hypothetical protein CVV56_04425 [Tenericutes bacterium HGW-Tenericutes-1]|jgi:uncharacterized membrane protein|nr:MAG: hypothetical protein CVV56_04425 [Tenericutes bacterium HGW-Tenericutes-1]
MNKYEFLYKLNKNLDSFKSSDRDEITHYYDELIQDAVDNGENEDAFIDRLGSVETIIRTIKKDDTFVTNVKEKKDFELRKVFSATSKLVGYAIFVFVIIVIGSIAFSFVTSGASLLVVGTTRMIIGIKNSVSSMTLIMYAGNIFLGIGLLLLGASGFWWLIKQSKDKLEKLLEWIQKTLDKRGE